VADRLPVRFEGLVSFNAYLGGLRDKVDTAARDAHRRVAERIADEMRSMVPVDSGALRDTIRVEVDDDEVMVAVGNEETDYAVYVEYGTRNRAATPFVMPAISRVAASLEETMAAEVRRGGFPPPGRAA